jgi:hypothetical protein
LLILRQWKAFFVQVACTAMIVLVIVNSRFWWLPLSETLYPERAAYFMNALAMIAAVEFYRAVPAWSKAYRSGWALAPILLLCCSITYFKDRYQRIAWQVVYPNPSVSYPLIREEEYEALRWCRDHLSPSTDIVAGEYNSAASYLPPVAGIACSGWHIHCLLIPKSDEFFRRHPPTHRWSKTTDDAPVPPKMVFRNSRVVITTIR